MNKFETKDITKMALFLALLILSSYIKITLPLIPITMQTMVVIGIGLLLGAKKGGFTVAVYILIGLLGFPVFSSGGGPSYIFVPSFGFIIGFFFTVVFIGALTNKLPFSLKNYIIVSIISIFVLYAIGIPYLYFISKVYNGSESTFFAVLSSFFMTYFPKDVISAIVMAIIAYKAKHYINKI